MATEYIRHQLFVGTFSGQVFYAAKVKVRRENGDGTALMEVVGEKHDVTESFDRAVKNRAKFLRSEKRRAGKAQA